MDDIAVAQVRTLLAQMREELANRHGLPDGCVRQRVTSLSEAIGSMCDGEFDPFDWRLFTPALLSDQRL